MSAVASASTAASVLNEISRQLFIYVGFGIFLIGIFGCCANIYLFTMRHFRKIPCSLFMWMGTIFDLIILCIALFLYRILNTTLRYYWMASNLFLCKAHVYLLDALLPVPIWCVCLSAFDRFCMTSRNVARRRWSTPKRSRMMLITLIAICLIYRLPDLYYLTIVSTIDPPICSLVPSISTYTRIHSYFTFPILLTTVPLAILITLSFAIRANLRLFTAQQRIARLERQITLMVLLQALGTACIVPYTVYIFYSLLTRTVAKSEYQLAVENLIYQIVLLCFYSHYASAFYIYLIALPDVRQNVQLSWRKFVGRLGLVNQVAPTRITVRSVNVPTGLAENRIGVNIIS